MIKPTESPITFLLLREMDAHLLPSCPAGITCKNANIPVMSKAILRKPIWQKPTCADACIQEGTARNNYYTQDQRQGGRRLAKAWLGASSAHGSIHATRPLRWAFSEKPNTEVRNPDQIDLQVSLSTSSMSQFIRTTSDCASMIDLEISSPAS